MKKIKKSSELMWVFGTIFVALGVSICSKANLGVSMIAAPAFIISEFLQNFWSGFTVGTVEYIFQGLLLILLCVIIRSFKLKYLFAFLVAFIYGLILDLFLLILSPITINLVIFKWLAFLIGDIITAFGVACFFKTYLPLQVYEFFVAEISKTFKINIHKTKWAFDISLLIVSITLALTLFGDLLTFNWSTIYYNSFHSIGLATVITTIINSPIIAFCSKIIDKTFENTPLLPPLYKYFEK